MPKYDITISYSKTIDAADADEAWHILREIEYRSNLDDEYGPFNSTDAFTEVEEVDNE